MKNILIGMIVLGLLLPAAASADRETVKVNCKKGDTIGKAIEDYRYVDELVIKIKGICKENVVIDRSGVTLRGVSIPAYDPEDPDWVLEAPVDGIEGKEDINTLRLVGVNRLEIFYTVENLLITGGNFALAVNEAIARLYNVHAQSTDVGGAIFGGAAVSAWDSSFEGGFWGTSATNAASFKCTRCSFFSPHGWGRGLGVSRGSSAELTNSEVRAYIPVSTSNGTIEVEGPDSVLESTPNIFGSGWSVEAENGGTILVTESSLAGPISAISKSMIKLEEVVHTSSPDTYSRGNAIEEDSTLILHDTSIDQDLEFVGFSNGLLRGNTNVSGDLLCSEGADAWCADPSINVDGDATSCGSCN